MITDKKTGIVYKEWKGPEPKAVFLLVHGLGAHTGRWEFLSEFFLKRHISSYAIELKGFGETKTLKGHIDSFNIYFEDIHRLRDIIVSENTGKRVFLVGESVGGLVSFLTAIEKPGLFDGLICISPAFASRLETGFSTYIRTLLPLFYNPKKQFSIPFDSKVCTRDVEYQKAMDADPREHRLATSRFIFELIMAQVRGNMLKHKVRIPVLFLLSGKDKLVDPEVSKKIFSGLKTEDKTIIQYTNMYHALSIDLDRERLFEDISAWVQKRI